MTIGDIGNAIDGRRDPGAPPPPRAGRPASIVAASLLTAAAALFWLAIAGIQALAFMGTQDSSTGLLFVWNAAFVAVYGWIAWSVWTRSESAASWALGTHSLNLLGSGYQAFNGVPCLLVAIPIHLAGAVAAWVVLKGIREQHKALRERERVLRDRE